MGRIRALAGAAAVVGAVVALGPMAPAYADDTLTVQGTSFPDPARARLSFVGCADLYQRSDEPLQPFVGLGPGEAPAGQRSLGFDLTGGNAVGSLYVVDSMLATTTASLAVHAPHGARGVAYAGYQAPADAGTTLVWLGRAELVSPGAAWQHVDATTRAYVWTKYDMATGQPVVAEPGAPASVADFLAGHGGDGPGFFTIGFGCDGAAFNLDALRVGPAGSVTTFDLEGLTTSVTPRASRTSIDSGDSVDLDGVLHTGTGDAVPHASMILEQRPAGSEQWTPVRVAAADGGTATATVAPTRSTFYRWRFVARPLAEGSVSPPLFIDVSPLVPSSEPSPSSPPSTSPPSTPPSTPPTSPPSSPPSSPASSAPASDHPQVSEAPSEDPVLPSPSMEPGPVETPSPLER